MGHHLLSRKAPFAAVVLAAATFTPAGAARAGTVGASAGGAPATPRAQADFNGDGLPDLAVGAPGEDAGTVEDAGAVNVIYGRLGGGLGGSGSEIFTQDTAGIPGTAETGDNFGSSLAVGDFNGDGRDDLAIGVPFEAVGSLDAAGAVNVLYGSAGGLTVTGSRQFTQNDLGTTRGAAAGDLLGFAVAAGDLGDTDEAELAIGSPGATVAPATEAGVVNVVYGSTTGLTGGHVTDVFAQNKPGIGSDPETGDQFGAALATGNADGGVGDLTVGVPGEAVGTVFGAGIVQVLFGAPAGLSGTGSLMFSQDSPGIGSEAEVDDFFGDAVAMGDFDGDGADDLAVGADLEDVGTIEDAGALNVVYAAPGGLNTGRASLLFTQDATGLVSDPETFDLFGFAVAAGDFDGDGADDLAIGVPGESVGTVESAGAVNTVYGVAGGNLNTGRPSQLLAQNTDGVPSDPEPFDSFGQALASADFDGLGFADLAIGVPGESVGTVEAAGAINVVHGAATGLTGIGSQVFHQGEPGIGSDPETLDFFGMALGAPAS